MLKNYILSAWRGLKRDKVTSLVNLFGLCVGMTSAVLISFWVQTELNFDDFHENATCIYRLTSNMSDKSYTWENTSYPIGSAVKREIPEVNDVTRCVIYSPIISIKGILIYQQNCAYVD